jgi:hypothetical protein
MHRGVIAIAATGVLVALPAGAARAEETAVEAESAPADLSQQLAAHAGMEIGGRTSPGGFNVGGTYQYRLSGDDWFDTGAGFTFGGGSAECFRDREGVVLCDHGIAKGFAAELGVGFRRVLKSGEKLSPFARIGLAVRFASFSGDDLRGAAFPLVVGGGVRSQVARRIAVVGGAVVRGGVGFFGDDVGTEPQISLTIQGGVEFGLD